MIILQTRNLLKGVSWEPVSNGIEKPRTCSKIWTDGSKVSIHVRKCLRATSHSWCFSTDWGWKRADLCMLNGWQGVPHMPMSASTGQGLQLSAAGCREHGLCNCCSSKQWNQWVGLVRGILCFTISLFLRSGSDAERRLKRMPRAWTAERDGVHCLRIWIGYTIIQPKPPESNEI